MAARHEQNRGKELTGVRGLLAAVIERAVLDAQGVENGEYVADAWCYFSGPVYRKHQDLLGLPADAMPKELEPQGEKRGTYI